MMRRTVPIFVVLLVLVAVVGGTHTAEEISRKSFPEGFVFGTATSAYQVEGMAHKDGRGPSIWDQFIKTPGLEPNNATGEVTVDQYHRYKEDINLMANLNFDAYRFSISWSRIFPKGTGKVNPKGVAYYNRLIDYMLKKGTFNEPRVVAALGYDSGFFAVLQPPRHMGIAQLEILQPSHTLSPTI